MLLVAAMSAFMAGAAVLRAERAVLYPSAVVPVVQECAVALP